MNGLAILQPRQNRHGDKGRSSDTDAEPSFLWMHVERQCNASYCRDNNCQSEKQQSRGTVSSLSRNRKAWEKLQQNNRSGKEFDQAIRTERQHRWAARLCCRIQRDTTLHQHPCERDSLKPENHGGGSWTDTRTCISACMPRSELDNFWHGDLVLLQGKL